MAQQQNDWQLKFHAEGTAPQPPEVSPAAAALTRALQLSFRLLTVIIVLLVVAFLLTGIRRVKPTQIGIRSVFGRIVGVADQGLTYSWPRPIGGVEMIDTSERKLEVNDFWMLVLPEHIGKPVTERRTRNNGLLPGYDGALLTGDGNLMHVQLICTYQVGRDYDARAGKNAAVLYKINVQDQDEALARKAGEVLHSESIIRVVVCRAAIHAAAQRPADRLRTDTTDFTREVRQRAQAQLDLMQTGLKIQSVAVGGDGVVWPLKVGPSYARASLARHRAQTDISDAMTRAQGVLSRAAGGATVLLVGEMNESGALGGGLIDDYIAMKGVDAALAATLLAQVEDVMINEATGEVQTILQGARTERTQVVEPIRARVERYRQLLPQYLKSPELTRSRLWADTREAILSDSSVEKILIYESDGKVVVEINRDPAMVKARRARAQGTAANSGDESSD